MFFTFLGRAVSRAASRGGRLSACLDAVEKGFALEIPVYQPDFTRNAKKRSFRFGLHRVNLQNIEIFHLVQGKLLVFEQFTLIKWLLGRFSLRLGLAAFVTTMEALRYKHLCSTFS